MAIPLYTGARRRLGVAHHIKRMQKILPSDIHCVVSVLQNEDYARLCLLIGRDNGTHTERRVFNIGVLFHIGQQIQSKLIQAQVHDAHTRVHFLQVDNIFL